MRRYQFFRDSEFQRANPPCSIEQMDDSMMMSLDLARKTAGVPFVINSAYRSVEHEKRKGRDGSSSHAKGLAVDLRCNDNRARFRMIRGLITAGFTRILVYKTFIHADMDPEKDQEILTIKWNT